jgi:2-oxo-4-hydroxy-4-carboxy-5-ureidoimidazoline decarboxylase
MSSTLARWNSLPMDQAVSEILPCCGSKAWARGVADRRPIADESSLLSASDEVWRSLAESDWNEAFASHPRIGERRAGAAVSSESAAWSSQEQARVATAEDAVRIALAEANRRYEQRFKRIFIVCASGRSAGEVLGALRRRMQNEAEVELQEAAEQQRQITRIRLKKWLQS